MLQCYSRRAHEDTELDTEWEGPILGGARNEERYDTTDTDGARWWWPVDGSRSIGTDSAG
jgi:hypothetical protein